MTGRVVCVGDVMVDVLATLPGPLAVGSDTPAPIALSGGGSAANTAAWLASLGTPTTFLGRVGDDALGRTALDELASYGVDLAVSVDPSVPTGMCIVLVDADGERTMVPASGANTTLPVVTDGDLLAPGTHLHVSAYALFHGARTAVDDLVHRAVATGLPVSVDAASTAPLSAFGVAEFLAWLPRCLLFANADEAALLAGTADAEHAARVLARRTGEAIVKLGAAGSVWSDGEAILRDRPRPVAVVDSTGAGDAFAAGVLAARLTGATAPDALARGAELAARAIAQVGARPGQPE